jgi:hypothetical protein
VAYKIVAKTGAGVTLGYTPASSAGSTATSNATLTSTNKNIVTFSSVTGAAAYDVYRTTAPTSPSTTGLIGTVTATINSATGIQTTSYAFSDTGLAGDSTTAPTVNTTGSLIVPVIGTTAGGTQAKVPNYVTAGGSNNAITVALLDAAGTAVPQAAGLKITVNTSTLTLQAGANTLALNGAAAANIKSHRAATANIGTAYAANSIVEFIFDGTSYLDLSQ